MIQFNTIDQNEIGYHGNCSSSILLSLSSWKRGMKREISSNTNLGMMSFVLSKEYHREEFENCSKVINE